MVKVLDVDRDENRVVQEAIFLVEGYLELTFRLINNEPKEVLRCIPESRLYDYRKLWLDPEFYKELIKNVYAVFARPGRYQGEQMFLFDAVIINDRFYFKLENLDRTFIINSMRIILSGGGTGGSVTPLLAVASQIKVRIPEAKFLFIGTREGIPERELASFAGILFQSIFSGKLRRYFDWRNIASPFLIKLGFIQSFFIILKTRSAAIISVGGFVSVPLVWAGRALRVPVFIHQQDVIPGLANKLMAPFARKITVSFEKSLDGFPKKKTVLTGNPIRPEILKGDKKRALKKFNLEANLPTLLVVGGGTGAEKINKLIVEIIPELVKFCQVIHLTGRKKLGIRNYELGIRKHYHQYEFLSLEMADAYATADLVISRAGMGVLTELAHLSKPTILIPIPGSHQEANAKYFAREKAAILLEQKDLTPKVLLENIRQILFSTNKRSILSLNISKLARPVAAQKIAKIILKNIKN